MYRLILNYMVIALTIGRQELTELVDRIKMKTKWQRFNLKVFLRAEWNLFNVFSIFLKEYSTKFTTIQFILSAMFFSYFRFLIFFSISNNPTRTLWTQHVIWADKRQTCRLADTGSFNFTTSCRHLNFWAISQFLWIIERIIFVSDHLISLQIYALVTSAVFVCSSLSLKLCAHAIVKKKELLLTSVGRWKVHV